MMDWNLEGIHSDQSKLDDPEPDILFQSNLLHEVVERIKWGKAKYAVLSFLEDGGDKSELNKP